MAEIKVYASAKEAYSDLFDNVCAMLLAQGKQPVPHKDEMYINYEVKGEKDFAKIKSFIDDEVKYVFGTDKHCVNNRSNGKKATVYFVKTGR